MRFLDAKFKIRDIILKKGIFQIVLKIPIDQKNRKIIYHASFLYLRMCRYPFPKISKKTPTISFFFNIVHTNNDPSCIIQALYGLYDLLFDNGSEMFEIFFKNEWFPVILDKLKYIL